MDLKKMVITVLIFGSIFVIWNYQKPVEIFAPCEKPIVYSIGTFDRRFGISYQTFLSALEEAEAIWEKPVGKDLFVYAPESSELTVNLIYDYRQETTGTLSNLEDVVTQDEATYHALRTKYISLKTEYDDLKNIYDEHILIFDEKNTAYQKQVESWNQGNRTSREQFKQLEMERSVLEREALELKNLESELNGRTREINNLVESLNYMVKSLNLNVKTYNTIGARRGETFVGGIYNSTEGVQEIDIYEFSSRDKLVRVLTHELGHALGLEHIEDREAMMYRLNEGSAKVLAKADLTALRALCGVN